jgi:hypothetical protein
MSKSQEPIVSVTEQTPLLEAQLTYYQPLTEPPSEEVPVTEKSTSGMWLLLPLFLGKIQPQNSFEWILEC